VQRLPALAAVRRALPDAEILCAVEERCAEILRDHPMIDNLIEVGAHGFSDGNVISGLVQKLLLPATK
jgi:ADP-heptose:LPS heptosyltransferase